MRNKKLSTKKLTNLYLSSNIAHLPLKINAKIRILLESFGFKFLNKAENVSSLSMYGVISNGFWIVSMPSDWKQVSHIIYDDKGNEIINLKRSFHTNNIELFSRYRLRVSHFNIFEYVHDSELFEPELGGEIHKLKKSGSVWKMKWKDYQNKCNLLFAYQVELFDVISNEVIVEIFDYDYLNAHTEFDQFFYKNKILLPDMYESIFLEDIRKKFDKEVLNWRHPKKSWSLELLN